jgi:hypothetical protein
MSSILRVDQIQSSTGTPLLSTDGTGVLSIDSRFKLPQYNTANLPTNAQTGEVVFDVDEAVTKFWSGDEWQSLGRKKLSSSILGMHYQYWTSSFQTSAVSTYQNVPGSQFTFQTKETGSSFILMADIPGYQDGSASGVNMAYQFDGVQYAGQNGNPGDTWMGSAHSGVASAGFNMKKIWVVSPNLSAGVTVTAACMVGHWSGTSSVHYFVYPGYNSNATFVILEFKNI